MNVPTFPSIITDKGLIQLGNYFEEYITSSVFSPEKLTKFQTLLLTYYMQTGNLIHKDVFDEIERKLQIFSDGGTSYHSKSIKFLHQSGCIDKNPKYVHKEKIK